MKKNNKLDRMVKVSLLSAIAFILMYFDFPVIPAFPWLKIDLSDVAALMGGFAFGPLTAVVIEVFKNVLIILFKGTGTGFIGELANVLVGVALVLPPALLYKKVRTKKVALVGMALGTVSIEVIGILANVFLLLPAYGMNLAGAELKNYILFGLLPFNGIKAIMVSVVTFILYKKLSVAVFKVEPMINKRKLEKKIS